MPTYDLIKSLLSPETGYTPTEKQEPSFDVDSLREQTKAYRTGGMVNPEPYEKGLEESDAPYEYIGPGEIKAAATGLAKGVPLAAGVLLQSRKDALRALKGAIDPATNLISKDKLIKDAYQMSNSPQEFLNNLSKLHGTSILEATGKPETFKGMKEASEVLSPMTKDVDVIHRKLKGLYGKYTPETEVSTIASGLDPLYEMSALGHENVGHAVEHKLIGLDFLKKILPYTEEKASSEMVKDPQFLQKVKIALNQSPMFKEALSKKFKTQKIDLGDPKILEYLRTLNFWDDPQRLLFGLTGKHNIFYPLNLEAEQTAQVMNRALKNESLNLDPEFIRLKKLLKKD